MILNESVHYMLIPMQHISVLRIFNRFWICTQSSHICKIPCSKTKSGKLSLRKFKSPLAHRPPQKLKSLTSVTHLASSLFFCALIFLPLELTPQDQPCCNFTPGRPLLSLNKIFGVHHPSNLEEHDCKSNTTKPSNYQDS